MVFSFFCDNLGLLIFVFGLLFHSKWVDYWLDYLKCIIFITLIKWLCVSSYWVGFDGPWVSIMFFPESHGVLRGILPHKFGNLSCKICTTK